MSSVPLSDPPRSAALVTAEMGSLTAASVGSAPVSVAAVAEASI
jgi:hypothetical protein